MPDQQRTFLDREEFKLETISLGLWRSRGRKPKAKPPPILGPDGKPLTLPPSPPPPPKFVQLALALTDILDLGAKRKRAKRNPLYDLEPKYISEDQLDRMNADLERRKREVQATWSEKEREKRNCYKLPPMCAPRADFDGDGGGHGEDD